MISFLQKKEKRKQTGTWPTQLPISPLTSKCLVLPRLDTIAWFKIKLMFVCLFSYSYLQSHCQIHGNHQAGESNTSIHNPLDKISIFGEYLGHEWRKTADHYRQEEQHHHNNGYSQLKTSLCGHFFTCKSMRNRGYKPLQYTWQLWWHSPPQPQLFWCPQLWPRLQRRADRSRGICSRHWRWPPRGSPVWRQSLR